MGKTKEFFLFSPLITFKDQIQMISSYKLRTVTNPIKPLGANQAFYILPSSSTSRTYFFQNQCCLQILFICSIGTFLVSGKNKCINVVITITHPPKKKKIPALKWQSIAKSVCPLKKINTRVTATVMLCPADLISNGNISLGTNHVNGPHEYENPANYTHSRTKIK